MSVSPCLLIPIQTNIHSTPGGRDTLMIKTLATIILLLLLSACSNDNTSQNGSNDLGDITGYTTENLRELALSGNSAKAIRIIASRAQRKIAKVDEYILLADIYNNQLDGISSELALDQANTLGATRQNMALARTKSLMLQGRFTEAQTELRLAPLSRSNGVELNLLEGEIALALGDARTARRYYELAREIEPTNYKIDTSLAILEMSQGRFVIAKELARAAIEKNAANNDSKPYYVLGAIDRLQKNSEQAISSLKTALTINENDMLAQLEIIGAYIDMNQLEQAEIVLDLLIAKNPNNYLAQFYVAYILAEKGQNREAEDVLLKAGNLLAEYRPAKRLYGHIAFDLQKYDTAANYLGQYLAEAPRDIETRLTLADTHTRTQRPQEALKVLKPLLGTNTKKSDTPVNDDTKTVKINVTEQAPKGPLIEAMARAGAAEQAAGNIEKARIAYQKAIAIGEQEQPVDTALIASLKAVVAAMEYNAGNRDQGLTLMKAATQVDSATPQEIITLANMQMLNGDLEGATETAMRLKTDTETAAEAENILGAIAYRRRDYQAAVSALNNAIQINPEYASAIKNRAAAFIALNQLDKALPDLLKLEAQAAGDGEYYGMLGFVQLGLKNYVAAIDAYEKARRIIPNSALFTANYASALGAKERYDEAIMQAKAALDMAPNDETFKAQVREMLARYEAAAEEKRRSGK